MNNIFNIYYNKIKLPIEKKINLLMFDLNKIYINTLLYKSLNTTIYNIEDENIDLWDYYKDINYL